MKLNQQALHRIYLKRENKHTENSSKQTEKHRHLEDQRIGWQAICHEFQWFLLFVYYANLRCYILLPLTLQGNILNLSALLCGLK